MSFAYLPLYTGDYFRDTRGLSMAGHGCYLLLLTYCWDKRGPLPLDQEVIAGICNARSAEERTTLEKVLATYFTQMSDGWYNRRMQQEIERAEAISRERSEAGRKGYQAKAKQLLGKSRASASNLIPYHTIPTPEPTSTPEKPPQSQKPSGTARKKRELLPATSAATWESYAKAYFNRYQTEPVRNASVNAQLSGLVKRLGEQEAPLVAAFYVGHNRGQYVVAKHPTSLLLRDCEGLRTEWATGIKVTEAAARMADKGSGMDHFAAAQKRYEEEEEANGPK